MIDVVGLLRYQNTYRIVLEAFTACFVEACMLPGAPRSVIVYVQFLPWYSISLRYNVHLNRTGIVFFK